MRDHKDIHKFSRGRLRQDHYYQLTTQPTNIYYWVRQQFTSLSNKNAQKMLNGGGVLYSAVNCRWQSFRLV